jgi:hypothetical protein
MRCDASANQQNRNDNSPPPALDQHEITPENPTKGSFRHPLIPAATGCVSSIGKIMSGYRRAAIRNQPGIPIADPRENRFVMAIKKPANIAVNA